MRDYSKFFTSPDTAKYMVELLNPDANDVVLEPSAGNGNLVRALREKHPHIVVCAVEINGDHKTALRSAGAAIVLIKDFLEMESIPRFSCCIANPPFGNGTDLRAHFDKMCDLVKKGGKIVMIVPETFDVGYQHTEHHLENWSTNSDGTTTPIKIIEFINPSPPFVGEQKKKN